MGEILKSQAIKDLVPDLKRIVEEIVEECRPIEVIIAGSLAKGEFVRGLSDIDLLVVVEHSVPDKERFSIKSIKDVDVEITIVSRHELEQAISIGKHFYVEAIKHGVRVYARTDEKHH